MKSTRRDILTGTAATAAFLAAPLAAVGHAAGDERLVALYAAWQRAHAEHSAACTRYGEAEEPYFEARRAGLPEHELAALKAVAEEAEQASTTACDRESDLTEQIRDAQPDGLTGLFIKIRVAAAYVRQDYPVGCREQPSMLSDQVMLRLADDLERLTRGGIG